MRYFDQLSMEQQKVSSPNLAEKDCRKFMTRDQNVSFCANIRSAYGHENQTPSLTFQIIVEHAHKIRSYYVKKIHLNHFYPFVDGNYAF